MYFWTCICCSGKVMVIGSTHVPQMNGLHNGTISFFSSWCLWQMHIQKVLFMLITFHPNINYYIHIWKTFKPPHHFMFQFVCFYLFLSSFFIFYLFLSLYIYIYVSSSFSISLFIFFYLFIYLCLFLFLSFEAIAQLRWSQILNQQCMMWKTQQIMTINVGVQKGLLELDERWLTLD